MKAAVATLAAVGATVVNGAAIDPRGNNLVTSVSAALVLLSSN